MRALDWLLGRDTPPTPTILTRMDALESRVESLVQNIGVLIEQNHLLQQENKKYLKYIGKLEGFKG